MRPWFKLAKSRTRISAPEGGSSSTQMSSTTATVFFKSIGNYSVAAQSGIFRCEASFEVIQAVADLVNTFYSSTVNILDIKSA